MKVKCSCGAKYEFAITPAMANSPVQFICPACGGDASDFVDSLVRRELGQTAKPAGTPVPVAGSLTSPTPQPRLSLAASPTPVQSTPVETLSQAAVEGQPCLKHPGQFAMEKCYICS